LLGLLAVLLAVLGDVKLDEVEEEEHRADHFVEGVEPFALIDAFLAG